jgi:hypothetical protein
MESTALFSSLRVHRPLDLAVLEPARRLYGLAKVWWRGACQHAERPQRVVPYY